MRSNLTTRPKKLIYFLYFLCYFVMLSWFYSGIAVASYQGHFIVNPQEISPGLSFVFQIWLIVNITTYMYIVITILQQGRAKLWRSKVWIYFNIYFAILLLVFVIVSGSVYEQSSKLMLMFYVSLNMYCIYMQYMFTATNTPKQNQKYIPIELNQQQNDSNVIEINTFSKRKQKSISSDL